MGFCTTMVQFVFRGRVPGKTRAERAIVIRRTLRLAQKAGLSRTRATFKRTGSVKIESPQLDKPIKIQITEKPRRVEIRVKTEAARQAIAQRLADRGERIIRGALKARQAKILRQPPKTFKIKLKNGRTERLTSEQARRANQIFKKQTAPIKFKINLPSGREAILEIPSGFSPKQRTRMLDNRTKQLIAKDRKRLTGLEARAIKLKVRETRLQQFWNNFYKRIGIDAKVDERGRFRKGGTTFQSIKGGAVEVLKAVGRFPFELSKLPIVIGGRLGLFADAIFDKQARRELVSAAKETPVAVINAFDPRTPTGVVNLVLVAATINLLARSRAARIKFNKEMSQAKITRAKIVTMKVGANRFRILKKGVLRVGKRNIPFREKVIVRGKLVSNRFTAKSLAKYRLTPKSVKQIKTITKGIKIIKKPIPGTRQRPKFGIAGRVRAGRVRQKFVTLGDGKTVVTIAKFKRNVNVINTRITKFKQINSKLSTFNSRAFSKYIPPKTLRITLINTARRIKVALKNPRLSKPTLKLFQAKLKTIKIELGKFARNKKGQIAIPRPGKLRPEPFSRQDVTAVDRILKQFDARMKAIEAIRAKPKVISRARIKIRPIVQKDFSSLLAGARAILMPKVIVFPGFVPGLKSATIVPVQVEPRARAVPEAIPIPDAIPGVVTVPEVVVISKTKTIFTTIFQSVAAASSFLALSRFIPLVPLPGEGPEAAFRLPSFRLGVPVKQKSFVFLSDLYSRLHGIRAKPGERKRLLRVGRVFSGLEARPIV